ncbi:MAG: hypothetical protein JWM90_3107 [Thermoleophilia bacterium]|nr:hypothetical protein [Thermoleophilia bacterium]
MASTVGGAVGASSASTTVGASILSATSLVTTGCPSGAAGITDFGALLPGASVTSSADCAVTFGSSNNTSMLLIRQADGWGDALWRTGNGPAFAGYAADGRYESTFGMYSHANAATSGGDGTYLAGFTGSPPRTSIVKLGRSGVPVAGWGTGGIATVDVAGAASDQGHDVVVGDDGAVFVAGWWEPVPGTQAPYVARLLANGTLDPAFGTGGITTLAAHTGTQGRIGLAVDAGGRPVGCWRRSNGTSIAFRLTTSGVLDSSWGAAGVATLTAPAPWDSLEAVACRFDGTGRLVVAGKAIESTGDYSQWWAARLDATGALDVGFDGDGHAIVTVGTTGAGERNQVHALGFSPTGQLVLTGQVAGSGPYDFGAARFTGAGALDNSYDTDGLATVDTNTGSNEWSSRGAVLPTGQVVGVVSDGRAFRLAADGARDTTFGTAGTVTFAGFTELQTAHLAQDGRIMVHGIAQVAGQDEFAASAIDGVAIADYDDAAGDDWATPSAAHFGACLRTVGAGATAAWTTGACGTTDGVSWNDVPATSDKIADGASGNAAGTVGIRFGMRMAPAQSPGRYSAPVVFEVTAPSA